MKKNLKKILLIVAAVVLLPAALCAQVPGQRTRRTPVRTANYNQAARFSAKKVGQMVYSTSVRPNWFAGSDRFWYSWKTSEGTRWYLVDPVRGTKEELFDNQKLARQLTEIIRDPFDDRHLPLQKLRLRDDSYFTFQVTSTLDKVDSTGKKKGKLIFYFEYDLGSRTLKKVGEKPLRYPGWAAVSPDGTVGVYAKGSNLWWMDSTSLRKAVKDPKDTTIVEHRLTTDGIREFGYGYGNYRGDAEADSTKRHMPDEVLWSPDGKRLAVLKWDTRVLKDLWVINSLGKRPELQTYKYQMPGEPGPKGQLFVMDFPSGKMHEVRMNAFKYQDVNLERSPRTAQDAALDYMSPKWLGDENGFWLERLSRDLKRLDLCYVAVGADSTRTVVSERSNTYVEWRSPKLVKGGRQLVWWSERTGWANLYLYDTDGTLIRELTNGAFHVEDVVASSDSHLLVSACGVDPDENPYQMHTFRVGYEGGRMKQLDMKDQDVDAQPSDDAKYFIANYSRVDSKPAVALFSAEGRRIMDLEEADFSQLFAAGYQFPERFKVKAADGITDLYGAIYKPFDFDSTKVYPVCDYVYPGPQVEAVNISWSKGFTRTDRLAQLGFIVVTVGNRGGHPNRSKWYHNYGYGNLRDYGLEDQKYAIQQLAARYPWMDIDRVGIHGHSGGGFMSTAAILTYPDFFKVAVSCAGNHDNSIYNRWWSEQHHGIQEKVAKGDTTFVYKIDTNQELAKNLKGHLLLVHGDVDDNVHPANTIRVVNALIRANKRFDFLYLPGQRHGFGDMNEYFFWRMADYYTRYLMGDTRPRPVDIPELNND